MKKSRRNSKIVLRFLKWTMISAMLILPLGPLNVAAFASAAEMAPQPTRTVTGVVKDQSGDPLVGVSVRVVGTQAGAVTGLDGSYSLNVSGDNVRVEFSFIGYETQRIHASGSVVNVTLSEDDTQLSEVVVVGFGVQKKENLTGSVDAIDVNKALGSKPISNIARGLQGVSPGLTVTSKSGNLGAGTSVNIRGLGTIKNGAASGSPLILVDGVPADLSMINPNDVATVSVLKDASAASIYGARGAFGVVLITTKKGSAGDKVRFNYSANVGFSKPSTLIEFVDPEYELEAFIEVGKRHGTRTESFGMYHDILLPKVQEWKKNVGFKKHNDTEMVYGEDWDIVDGRAYTYRVWDAHKVMLRDWTPQQIHNLSAQGGLGEKSSFLLSLGYTDQSGFMRLNTDKLKRYNANLSLTTQLASWLKADVGVLFSRRTHKEPYNFYGGGGRHVSGQNGYFGYYMRWGQYFPYGTYEGKYFRHAPGYLANANMNLNQKDLLRLSGMLTADITKDITLNLEYSLTTDNSEMRINGKPLKLMNFWAGGWDPDNIEDMYQYVTTVGSSHDQVAYRGAKQTNHVFNAYANYAKTFSGDHNLSATAGTNIEKNEYQRNYAERRNVMDPSLSDINLATGDQYVTSNWSGMGPAHTEYAIAGFFARVNYDYKGKYLVELNARYDGSSSFPRDELWGFFPSASVGYRITEEPFMRGIKKVVNDIKIRASAGSIGNQDVVANAFRPMMTVAVSDWIDGGARPQTVSTPTLADRSLSWEKITTYNVGIDMRFNNNMFGLSFDWFQRENKDMLARGKTLPSATGMSAPWVNAGSMRTRGWEVSFDYNQRINKDVALYATATVSDYNSTITKWDNPNKMLGSLYEGMKIGEIWGLETDRLFQKDDFNEVITTDKNGKEVINYVLKDGIATQDKLIIGNFKYGPGDVKYVDRDGDGEISRGDLTAENPGDLKVIGNTTPRYQYGIRLGAELYGFDIDIFFQGVGKRDYWATSDLVLPMYNRADALYGKMMDYWTEDNTGAYFPNPWMGHASNAIGGGVAGSNNFVQQSRYLLNMAYLRLKNLTIGYTIPPKLTKRIGIDRVRVYFSGQNLAEFKSSKLPVDPEINETEANWGRTYPYPRTISFGLQVDF